VSTVVLDASALLALLLGEPGADVVRSRRAGAVLSAVNYAEVLARTVALCGSLEEAKRRVDRQEVEVIPLDQTQAAVAASLAPAGKPLGLALADRCCLALALTRRQPVLTADRDWRSLKADIDIVLIR
jgi:PIN domain nuclease of toxin-antitoxin system